MSDPKLPQRGQRGFILEVNSLIRVRFLEMKVRFLMWLSAKALGRAFGMSPPREVPDSWPDIRFDFKPLFTEAELRRVSVRDKEFLKTLDYEKSQFKRSVERSLIAKAVRRQSKSRKRDL